MKHLRLFAISIALLAALNIFGQTAKGKPTLFDYLGKAWSDYEKNEMDKNFLSLSWKLYKEVSNRLSIIIGTRKRKTRRFIMRTSS